MASFRPVTSKSVLTYFLNPLSRVLLENLNGSELLKKFPAFYGTRRFITAFTSARHLSLSLARSIQPMPPHPTSWEIHLNIILPSTPGPSKCFFTSGSPTKTLYTPLLFHVLATCPAHLILLDFITRIILGEEHRSLSSSLYSFFFRSTVTLSVLGPNILLNILFLNTLSLRSSKSVAGQNVIMCFVYLLASVQYPTAMVVMRPVSSCRVIPCSLCQSRPVYAACLRPNFPSLPVCIHGFTRALQLPMAPRHPWLRSQNICSSVHFRHL